MAIMIPSMETKEDFNASGGELLLYELLAQLPDDYYIFHSTRWNEKLQKSAYSGAHRYVQWGEADFTIFHPVYGFIVFEVKDGQIAFSRERGWIQINRYSGHEKIIDPMEQAERSKYYFLDQIKRRFGGSSPYSFCSAVWFTSGDKACVDGAMPLNYKEETVLWSNDLQSPTSAEMAIRKVYRYYDVKHVVPSNETTAKVLDTLAPEFGVFESIRSRMLSTKAMFRKMTAEQMYLLDYLEEQEEAAIHGVAGTGKTVLAVQKAKSLSESGPVLFLCFNRFLKNHLQNAYSAESGIAFYTLDGLLTKYTSNFSQSPSERTEMITEFLMDWDQYEIPFCHIVIDEGQDFQDEHLQLLHAIARSKNGCFYVFYDKNQFVQGVNYAQWLDQMECRLVLSRNCRNTKEIAITSTRPIGLEESRIKMRREFDSFSTWKPKLFFVDGKTTLQEYLAKLIKKYTAAGIKEKDIVVLSMKPEGKSMLQQSDLCISGKYILSREPKENSIFFTTVRKFKGLEAEVIICIDIDKETFSSPQERNVFYVGTSRAMAYLDLLSLSSPEELATAIDGGEIYSKRPQAIKAVRDCLKVKIASAFDLTDDIDS